MRFITDCMLGKITKWLRMLGQDVLYADSTNDRELALEAKKENRVLLTRDHELFQHSIARGVEAVLVEGQNRAEILAKLAKRFKFQLNIDVSVSRCPKCNSKIKKVGKEEVINSIERTTAELYDNFWRCNMCEQVYWQGSHWKKIEQTLNEAKKIDL